MPAVAGAVIFSWASSSQQREDFIYFILPRRVQDVWQQHLLKQGHRWEQINSCEPNSRVGFLVCSQCPYLGCCRDYGMSMWFFRQTLQSITCHQLFSPFSSPWFIVKRLCLTMVLTFVYIPVSLEVQLFLKLRREQPRGDPVLQGKITATLFCFLWLWHQWQTWAWFETLQGSCRPLCTSSTCGNERGDVAL